MSKTDNYIDSCIKKNHFLTFITQAFEESDNRIIFSDDLDSKKYSVINSFSRAVQNLGNKEFNCIVTIHNLDLIGVIKYNNSSNKAFCDNEDTAFTEFRRLVNSLLKQLIDRYSEIQSLLKEVDDKNNFPIEKFHYKAWQKYERDLIEAFCLLSVQSMRRSLETLISPDIFDTFHIISPNVLRENKYKISETTAITGNIISISGDEQKIKIRTKSNKPEIFWDLKQASVERELMPCYADVIVVVMVSIYRGLIGIKGGKDKFELISFTTAKQEDIFK